MTRNVLVAGIGNIFLGDDGFGVEVAKRLAQLKMPDGVAVGDYGISGMHLAYDLADGVQTAILVDAMPRGGEPGTVYVVEPQLSIASEPLESDGDESAFFNAHGMQPDVVLGLLGTLGAEVGRVLIVGCEPASADYGIGLSEPVAAAVDEAVRVVLELIGAASGSGGSELKNNAADRADATGQR